MRLLVAAWLLLLPLLGVAGDTAAVRIIPEELTPGQPFRMEIAVTSTDDFPGPALRIGSELPALDNIPLRFSGQRVSSGNLTTLLVSGVAPEAPGDYTIPAFTATLAVRKVAVPATRLRVKPAAPGAESGFARFSLELPNRTFYVGETIPAVVVLAHGANERVTGFYGIEGRGDGLTSRSQGQAARPTEGPMRVPLEITPTQAGTLDLRVGGMALVDSPAGDLGGRNRPFLFTRKLRVAHVPERDRPADWTGAVGSISAGPVSISNPSPGIGEPTTLTLVLKGTGNLDRILAPEVPHGDAWDVQPTATPSRGVRNPEQRIFTYTLIPRLPGNLRTPTVRISSFNPETGKYERVEFPPVDVKVTGQAPAQVDLIAAVPAQAAGSPEAQAAKRATELAEPRTGGRIVGAPPVLADVTRLGWTQLGAALALAGALGWAARRDWLARHPELVRRRAARRALRKARRALRRALRRQDEDAHAEAAVAALRAGAAGIIAATDRALTAEDVLRALPDLAEPIAVRNAFRRADGTRFGGGQPQGTLTSHAALERSLAQLESGLCD